MRALRTQGGYRFPYAPGFLGDRKHPIFAGDNAGREIKKGWPDGPREAIHGTKMMMMR